MQARKRGHCHRGALGRPPPKGPAGLCARRVWPRGRPSAHRAWAGSLTRSWHMVRVIICVCVAQCHGKAQDGRRGAVTLPNSLWGYFLVHSEVVGVYELFKCGILLRGSYLKFTPRLRLFPQIDCHTCAIPVCRAQEAPDYFPRNGQSLRTPGEGADSPKGGADKTRSVLRRPAAVADVLGLC